MYTLSSQSYFISSTATQKSRYWHIRDAHAPRTTQKILERYIKDAQNVFMERITLLTDFDKRLTPVDEKRLYTMLELLIDTRKIWEDESHS
jgi:hypothetical protein